MDDSESYHNLSNTTNDHQEAHMEAYNLNGRLPPQHATISSEERNPQCRLRIVGHEEMKAKSEKPKTTVNVCSYQYFKAQQF